MTSIRPLFATRPLLRSGFGIHRSSSVMKGLGLTYWLTSEGHGLQMVYNQQILRVKSAAYADSKESIVEGA